MNFSQSKAYLDLLAEMGIKAGLDHTRVLAGALGDPQDRYPCILIGGTNGKGTVAAVLASVLKRAGYRVGLYTSPHLVDVRERIRVDGGIIGPEEFAEVLTEVRAAADGAIDRGEAEGPPTHFEALTLAAMLHFSREKVSFGVLEVGLGGRWDCTNIAEPVAGVVTNIGIDHEEWLGKGLRSIAFEKAGIFRAGRPALTGARREEALEVLRREALKVGASLRVPFDCSVRRTGGGLSLDCPEGRLDLPLPALAGRHQVENMALACRAGLTLRELGWTISDESFREGVSAARWPGRLQKVADRPILYLDGAHNPDACHALRAFTEGLPRPRVLVFTAMSDKPVEKMAEILFPAFDHVVATRIPMERCLDPEQVWGPLPEGRLHREGDAGSALERASAIAGTEGAVVVAGSLYLVGNIMERLGIGPVEGLF